MKPEGFGIELASAADAHGCPGGVFGGQTGVPPGAPLPPGPDGGVHPAGAVCGGGGQTSADAEVIEGIYVPSRRTRAISELRSFMPQ